MIDIGKTSSGRVIALPLKYANRHGLVTGATGTGKTVTLQRMAEEFSAAGVPVFAADVKGDLSGIAAEGEPDGKAAERSRDLGRTFRPEKCPAVFWDIFAIRGLPIRTSVHAIGPALLASMLKLNATQSGALEIAFRRARDEGAFFLTLDDLRWALNEMLELREETCKRYGNVTASSIAAIQRGILALEAQGGHALFGEPPFDIRDFLRTENGKGVVNLLHADNLMEAPKLYATFLLWLLTELFRALPEAGDLDKPKLVFFFDEAHLLFTDAPRELLQSIERLVRLVRSKGVGVFFVTQSPADVPDAVLSQLGNRVQHALRAYTPKDQRFVKAAASAFRPNPDLDVKAEITGMAIGEALVSVMESDGVPSIVQKVKVFPPAGKIGPLVEFEREDLLKASSLRGRYYHSFRPQEMASRFVDRMRREAGIGPIEREADARQKGAPQKSDWQEGDFAAFIPDITPRAETPPRARPRTLAASVFAFLVAAVCFRIAGLI